MKNRADNNYRTDETELRGILCLMQEYTNQIDAYDRNSSSFAMTTIGFFGVITSVLAAFYGTTDMNVEESKAVFYFTASVLLMIIPCVSTLFLYVFSMNCRKVALYRGYLDVLEKRLNSMGKTSIFNYNTIVDREILGKYPTNMVGPIIMFIFLAIIYCTSFYVSQKLIFERLLNYTFYTLLAKLWWSILIVSAFASALFLYGLVTNDKGRIMVRQRIKWFY